MQYQILKCISPESCFLFMPVPMPRWKVCVMGREKDRSGSMCCHSGTRLLTFYGPYPSVPVFLLPISGRGGWARTRTSRDQTQKLITSHCGGRWTLKATGSMGLASTLGCYSISVVYHDVWPLELKVKFSFDVSKPFVDLSRAPVKINHAKI